MNYLEGYNASEGFFAIQDQFDSKELLLMLDCGIFYEFISLSNYNNGKKDAICLKDVKLNIDYVMIISTNAGLWRYIIGDVIKFKSFNFLSRSFLKEFKHFGYISNSINH